MTVFAAVGALSRLGDGVRGVIGIAVGLFILAASSGALSGFSAKQTDMLTRTAPKAIRTQPPFERTVKGSFRPRIIGPPTERMAISMKTIQKMSRFQALRVRFL